MPVTLKNGREATDAGTRRRSDEEFRSAAMANPCLAFAEWLGRREPDAPGDAGAPGSAAARQGAGAVGER